MALLEGVDRMQAAVDGLIVAVRRGKSTTDQADAAEVVTRHLEFWGVLAREQGRPVTAVLDPGPLPVPVGAEELGSMVDGLLGNVFSHTKPGTPFEVKLVPREESEIVLIVSDAGDGFPAGVDPMRRGVSGKGSTGLGLDIARRVAERCHGSVRLGRSRLGGAEVEVRLRQSSANPGF
jgi:signal transduction histidine kinase